MDNNKLEDILHSRFSSVRDFETQGSLVPEVMRRVALLEDLARPSPRLAGRDWLVIVAGLLGALIAISTWQDLGAFQLEGLISLLPLDAVRTYGLSATTMALVILSVSVMLPYWWLVTED